MRIGANRHTPAAVSADDRPIMVAALGVDLPTQDPVANLALAFGNGFAGAIVSAFFTDPAEVQNAWLPTIAVSNQGHFSGNYANSHPGSL